MNLRHCRLAAGFLFIGGALAAGLMLTAGSPAKRDWPANAAETLRRTEEYIERTQTADEALGSGQTEKALALYRQIQAAYRDLDQAGYVATAIEDCLKKRGNQPLSTSMPSQTLATTQAVPPQVLDLKEIKIRYVHPVGKTRIQRSTLKNLKVTEMNDGPPTRSEETGITEIHYTCRKVNPDGTGVYDVSMPRTEEKGAAGGSFMTSRYEKGKPARVTRTKPPSLLPFNPKVHEVVAEANANVTFTMLVACDGTPLKVQGYQEAFGKYLNKALKGVGPLSKFDEQNLKAIRTTATDSQMLDRMKTNRWHLPKQHVLHVGDTWNHGESSNQAYRLVAIEIFNGRPCAKIQMHTPSSKAETGDQSSQNRRRTGEVDGYLYLDYEKGEILLRKQAYSFEFEQTIKSHSIHSKEKGVVFSRMETLEP